MKISEVAGNDLTDDWMRQQHVWIQGVLSRLNARYPLARCGVSYTDNPGMDSLAYAGGHTMIINTAYWKPDVLEKYQREWKGLVVDPTPEGTIQHEYGHVLVKAIAEVVGLQETWDIVYKHASIPNELKPIMVQPVSPICARECIRVFSRMLCRTTSE